jgi:hypothetical protein
MGLSVNENGLEQALEVSAPYGQDNKKTTTELGEHLNA